MAHISTGEIVVRDKNIDFRGTEKKDGWTAYNETDNDTFTNFKMSS
jgi:hypothetical protein